MSRVTQAALARRLGVSQALVARALKDDPAVAVATRARVRAEADRLGYRPNATARALLSGRTGLVGLWIPRPYGSYAANIIFNFEKLAQAAGADLLIRDLGPLGQSTGDHLRHMGWVDGFIVVDAVWQIDPLLQAAAASRPCVGLGVTAHPAVDGVTVDLYLGALRALRHLRSQGCRRIAYLFPGHPLGEHEARWRAYARIVDTPEVIEMREPTRAAAHEAMLRHLRRHGPPDGVFCHNDDFALGALRALRERKLHVPREVAVVGCDGIEDTEYLDCPITTIRLPYEEMCRHAWRFLVERMDGLQEPPRQHRLQPELLVRASSLRRG